MDSLPEVRIGATLSPRSMVSGETGKGNNRYGIMLANTSSAPAVQTRVRTLRSLTQEDILPVFYSDNYLSLMPGESRTIAVGVNPKYLKGGRPVFELSGLNTKIATIGGTQNRK